MRQAHIVEATSRSTESRAFVHGSELGYCLEKLSERFDERADSLLQGSRGWHLIVHMPAGHAAAVHGQCANTFLA